MVISSQQSSRRSNDSLNRLIGWRQDSEGGSKQHNSKEDKSYRERRMHVKNSVIPLSMKIISLSSSLGGIPLLWVFWSRTAIHGPAVAQNLLHWDTSNQIIPVTAHAVCSSKFRSMGSQHTIRHIVSESDVLQVGPTKANRLDFCHIFWNICIKLQFQLIHSFPSNEGVQLLQWCRGCSFPDARGVYIVCISREEMHHYSLALVPSVVECNPSLSNMPFSASGATAQGAYATTPTEKDPYTYQVGFGNRFASEALYVFSLHYP